MFLMHLSCGMARLHTYQSCQLSHHPSSENLSLCIDKGWRSEPLDLRKKFLEQWHFLSPRHLFPMICLFCLPLTRFTFGKGEKFIWKGTLYTSGLISIDSGRVLELPTRWFLSMGLGQSGKLQRPLKINTYFWVKVFTGHCSQGSYIVRWLREVNSFSHYVKTLCSLIYCALPMCTIFPLLMLLLYPVIIFSSISMVNKEAWEICFCRDWLIDWFKFAQYVFFFLMVTTL